MSNVKAQSSNIKPFGIWALVIHLTFACLREAASAKAGISIFGFRVLPRSIFFE
jgi:hypothetical protein